MTTFTAKYHKSGKRPRQRFYSAFKTKKNGQNFFIRSKFSSTYEQSKSQHYSSVKIRCVKIVFNTVAKKASYCSVLISGLIDETRMYYTNKKRSNDLSEYKKQHCLNFQKFTHTVSSFISNESII